MNTATAYLNTLDNLPQNQILLTKEELGKMLEGYFDWRTLQDDWIELSETSKPPINEVVYIKRRGGNIYIGHRQDKPISTNQDASRNCWWYATPSEGFVVANNRDVHFGYNFSDVTVTHWRKLPILPK